MKNTCVVRVSNDGFAYFHPGNNKSNAWISAWPDALCRKFNGAGIYSIRSVEKSSAKSVRVAIQGLSVAPGEKLQARMPATWLPFHYGICAQFLDKLGVTPPPEGKWKTLHLVVTKRRK
jgi:hypothetical protein